MTQEALKVVMDALDDLLYWDNGKPEYDEARKAVQVGKQALAQTQEPVERYPSSWAKVTLMVSPKGEMHAIGGDQELGEGDMPYIGLDRIKERLKDTPPQRTWVGLTDEDMKGMSYGDKSMVACAWADRTLRGKNT
jgi:hypothetical protein